VGDVVVLRASPKAIQVRLVSGAAEWVPLRGIDKNSPVQGDGDSGELWLQPWCAKMKGWGPAAPAAQEGRANLVDDMRRQVRQDVADNGALGDDDLPF